LIHIQDEQQWPLVRWPFRWSDRMIIITIPFIQFRDSVPLHKMHQGLVVFFDWVQ
jgi:hypothetical protein